MELLRNIVIVASGLVAAIIVAISLASFILLLATIIVLTVNKVVALYI